MYQYETSVPFVVRSLALVELILFVPEFSVPPRLPRKTQLEKRQSDSSTDDDSSVYEMDLAFQRYMWDRRWRRMSKYVCLTQTFC